MHPQSAEQEPAGEGAASPPADRPSAQRAIHIEESANWPELPEAVRERIVELAAAALAKLRTIDIPRQLRQ